ncbi:Ubiquitin carboxyl-terminal hydrolase 4, partial [Paragonimus heterotremus]
DQLCVATLLKQNAEVTKYLNLPVEGRSWYVIDYQWWTKWNSFIEAATDVDNLDVARDDYPGEIDNTNLLTPDGQLKPDLLREEDITVIPEEVWKMFTAFYGCVHSDTSVFKRTAVQTPSGKWVVEIYPPCFAFLELETRKVYFEGTYSESQTIAELKSIVRKHLNLGGNVNVRLFVLDGSAFEELTNDGVTIGEASLERKKALYFKIETINGLRLSYDTSGKSNGPVSSALFASSSGTSLSQYGSGGGAREKPGVCGLSNLGNTCFMNSAIQCISNVPELTAYFLGDWKKDINKYNPLGTHGRIASAYAELIGHMWSGLYLYDVPRTLKREIALIANQFYGYAQHDSHELLVFLLDGLHEDLNRVINKPYVETKDAGDREDEVVAEEAWLNHKARNDSIIVDYFHGQLKSTVICPTCEFRSVTFDPFASLNLPLPEVSRYNKSVYLWPWIRTTQQTGPIRLEVPVTMVFYVRDLIASLEQIRRPHSDCQYFVTEVYNHSMSRPFHMDHQIRDRYGPPVFVYELPPGHLIPVRLHQTNCYNTSGWVGIPFFISVPYAIQPNVNEEFLTQSIASRLRAIGIHSPDGWGKENDRPNPSGETELTNVGDRIVYSSTMGHNSSATAALTGTHEEPDTDVMADTASDSTSETVMDSDAILNSNEDALDRFLTGRIRLTNDQNQEINTDLAKAASLYDSTRIDLSYLRLTIDCSDSSLQTQLDDLMQSINPAQQAYLTNSSSLSKTPLRLTDCMVKFIQAEKLSARDLWYCRRCKGEKQATKKFDLWSLPKVLVIQLKRFRSTLRSRDKIDCLVDFPIRGLDLTPWVVRNTNERYIYDLIAVSNHMGYLGGGHYTAYALNEPTKRWYVFDDASTRMIDESKVVTSAAYVLIYRRRPDDSQSVLPFSNQSNSFDPNLEDSGETLNLSNGHPYSSESLQQTHLANHLRTPLYINDDDLTNVE